MVEENNEQGVAIFKTTTSAIRSEKILKKQNSY